LRNSTNLTLVATSAPIVVFGDLGVDPLHPRNIMLITSQSISFAGGSLLKTPQTVEGIFVATTYDGTVKLDNTDSSKRWVDDGRLVINGILIGGNIDALSKSRRSVIENWYN
jgi:uracil DNA glycosylase